LGSLTALRIALALAADTVVAVALNPIFVTPFPALLGRTVFIAMVLLLAFTAAGHWPQRGLPDWLPRWVAQVAALAVSAPLATLLAMIHRRLPARHAAESPPSTPGSRPRPRKRIATDRGWAATNRASRR
jgi:hypothetical protein